MLKRCLCVLLRHDACCCALCYRCSSALPSTAFTICVRLVQTHNDRKNIKTTQPQLPHNHWKKTQGQSSFAGFSTFFFQRKHSTGTFGEVQSRGKEKAGVCPSFLFSFVVSNSFFLQRCSLLFAELSRSDSRTVKSFVLLRFLPLSVSPPPLLFFCVCMWPCGASHLLLLFRKYSILMFFFQRLHCCFLSEKKRKGREKLKSKLTHTIKQKHQTVG